MAARPVKFIQGNYYHIWNRGAHRQSIFRSDENFRFARQLLIEYARRFNVTIIAYCLLHNHYHFLLRQDSKQKAGLVPQYLFNRYTKAFNKQHNHSGTLFEGPYQAKHVDKDEYLRHLCRYIHANPVLHGLAQSPKLWPYSNYQEWMEARPNSLVDSEFIDEHFGSAQQYAQSLHTFLMGDIRVPDELRWYLEKLEQ